MKKILASATLSLFATFTFSVAEERVDVNDVSILFPAPTTQVEIDRLISIGDVRSKKDKSRVFPIGDFVQILMMATSPEVQVEIESTRELEEGEEPEPPRIRKMEFVPGELKDYDNWKIAGIRVDPCAVGGSEGVAGTFGLSPQIRLILQPAGTLLEFAGFFPEKKPTNADVAIHLIYNFGTREEAGPGVIGKAHPDREKVVEIMKDVLALKKFCEEDGISTDGPLGVHPGLKNGGVLGFRKRVERFLEKYLHADRLNGAAVMALNDGGPEPWLFLSLIRRLDEDRPALSDSRFVPFPSVGLGSVADQPTKFTQMIGFIDEKAIIPEPSTTNRLPLEQSNVLAIPAAQRRGVSTSPLFDDALFEDREGFLDKAAAIGVDEEGNEVADEQLKNKDIADFIANPEVSHFFNTDCASCHTETTRRAILELPASEFAYDLPEGVSGVDPEVLPDNQWNTRNFGWFGPKATVTQRTANETAEVVEFINEHILGD